MNTFSSLSQTTKRGTMTFRLAAFLVLWVLSTLPTIANATALANTGSDAHISHAELFDGAEVRQLSTNEMSDTHGELSPIEIVIGAALIGLIALAVAGGLNNANEIGQKGQTINDLSNVDQEAVMNCAMNPCNGQIGVTAEGTVGVVEDTSDNTTNTTTDNTTTDNTTNTPVGPSGYDGSGVTSNSGGTSINFGSTLTNTGSTGSSSVSFSYSYGYTGSTATTVTTANVNGGLAGEELEELTTVQ